MTGVFEKGKFVRLEDFIVLAQEGKDVHVEIKLSKQRVTRKVDPEKTAEMKDELDMSLLIADYTFRVGEKVQNVSKVYMFGSRIKKLAIEDEQTFDETLSNIANKRLKVDYERLKGANIKFIEKYF